MDTFLCIATSEHFFGSQYFHKPAMFHEQDIKPVIAEVDEFSEAELQRVTELYPEEEVAAVLVHQQEEAKRLTEHGAYPDTPLIKAGHVAMRESRHNGWDKVLQSGRDVYLMTGTERSGRTFLRPGYDNVRVVLCPVMGRSVESHDLPNNFIDEPEKNYDIGFFSALTFKKRPHRVMETANNAARILDRTLDVWIAGIEKETVYSEFISEFADEDPYPHINVDYEGMLPNRKLYRRVQQTQVMYLPLVKPTETTCYSAWEVVSYDVPLVGTDWAGVGEATRHARHPLSTPVPVERLGSVEDAFHEEVREAYPDVMEKVADRHSGIPMGINELQAQRALINALTMDYPHDRELKVPDQVHAETSIAAIRDIIDGELPVEDPLPDALFESEALDRVETTTGYSVLRNSEDMDPSVYQASTCFSR